MNHGEEKPKISDYTVICESQEAEIIYADVESIFKHIKRESSVIDFMNQQLMKKYPDQMITDEHFSNAFKNSKSPELVKSPYKSLRPT
jgi:hypothetical protein